MTATRDLVGRVREILLTEWDPIGISDEPRAQDEYDMYAAPIAKLVSSSVTSGTLADHLISIERDRMELAGDRDRATRVATKLVALKA